MKFTIKGQELLLDNREVKSAKRLVSKFMESVNSSSRAARQPTYYFTVLIMMHVMSQDALDMMDEKSLARIMNNFQKLREMDRQ